MKYLVLIAVISKRWIGGFVAICFSISAEAQFMLSETQVVFDKTSGAYVLNTAEGEFYKFTPSISDIEHTDSLIQAYLVHEYSSDSTIQYKTYYRQYIGILKNGLEVIVVYSYCRKPKGFSEQPDLVKGGGRCYSIAQVNPKGGKLLSFHFNAPK